MTDKPKTPATDKKTNESAKKENVRTTPAKPTAKPTAKTAKPPAKKAPATPKEKKGNSLAWVALILIIAVAAAGVFAYITIDKKLTSVATSSANAAQQNQQAASALSNSAQSSTEALQQALNELTTKHQALEEKSSEKISLLQSQVGKNKRQWLISEAQYVTSVANTRLYLVGDVATAIAGLEAADQRLKENGDPIVFPVREQIAREIASLKRVELPDVVGLSSKLLILEESVSEMEITEPHAGKLQAPEIGKGDVSPIPENIQQTLNDAWANFSKLVVVRRSDEPMSALMTPEQVELIRKNLALKIEAARLALINKDKELYAASLAITADWLAAYFDPNNAAVKAAIEQINALKGISITVDLPDISKSLQMLRDLPLTSLEPEKTPAPAVTEKAPAPEATQEKIVSNPVVTEAEPIAEPEEQAETKQDIPPEPKEDVPAVTPEAPSEEKTATEPTDKN
jgi:uncharacterized protein HemX